MENRREKPDNFTHKDLDGVWNRLLPDGTLELRDPNDGAGGEPEKAQRRQYNGFGGSLWVRTLPPEGQDSYADSPGNGEFPEPWRLGPRITSETWGLIREFSEWAKKESEERKPFHAPLPRYNPGCEDGDEIVVEETPNGRSLFFWEGEKVYAVQPANDNYFEKFKTLKEARDFVGESFGLKEQQHRGINP